MLMCCVQTLDHMQMARMIVSAFPRPVNMWEITTQLLQSAGAECLVGPAPVPRLACLPRATLYQALM